jgi:hypothetical protein
MAKRLSLALALVVVLVLLGVVVQWRWLAEPAPAPGGESASASAARPAHERILVREAVGKVERRGPDGKWQALATGDEINPSDELRTGAQSSARLDLGLSVVVTVADETELNVGELSSTLSRVRLDDGRIVSEVRGSKDFRFRVQVKGSEAVAEAARGGKFAVLKRGEAGVTVASEQGSVLVVARNQGVRVGAGEQSVVEPGAAPSPPSRIPSSLLLKLGRPPLSRLQDSEIEVSGETNPGATVIIDGVAKVAGADGQFARAVTLREGRNDIVVTVEDALGRRREATLPNITVDRRAPGVSGKVVW